MARIRLCSPAVLLLLSGCRASPPLVLPPGPTFGEPVLASDVTGAGQSEPALVADSSGRLTLAWMDWRGRHPTIRVSTSSDGGARFGPSRLLLPSDQEHGEGEADPSLIRTDSGRVWIGWEGCRAAAAAPDHRACDVYAASSDDGGKSFSPPLTVKAGGEIRRDRPWLATDGETVYASWTEEVVGPPSWHLARLEGAAFAERASLPERRAVFPVAGRKPGVLEALLVMVGHHDPSRVLLERRISPDGGHSFGTLGTVEFELASVIFPYSLGALSVGPDGESWVAIPHGDGMDNDFVLAHREAGEEDYVTSGMLRAGHRGRTALPSIARLAGGRFLAAWVEQTPEGGLWRTQARLLGPGTARSAASDLSRVAFRLVPASLTLNPGDFLSVAPAGGSVWVAWSDTRDGEARVRVASSRLAER